MNIWNEHSNEDSNETEHELYNFFVHKKVSRVGFFIFYLGISYIKNMCHDMFSAFI